MAAATTGDVVGMLREYGQRLSLAGGNPYRARAYLRAAEALATVGEPLEDLIAGRRLTEIPGVGDAIAAIITTMHRTGSYPKLEEMRRNVPAGVLQLLALPGLRPDKVLRIYRDLGIASLDDLEAAARSETGQSLVPVPRARPLPAVIPTTLAAWLHADTFGDGGQLAVIDVTNSANYVKRHIPGAWFAIRANLREALARIPRAKRYVVTCGSGQLAAFAGADLRALLPDDAEVFLLEGGTLAWIAAGLPLEHGETRLASPLIDRYRRPYEGTGNAAEAMQAYLDWEYGLVEQLGRDGTHGFNVI